MKEKYLEYLYDKVINENEEIKKNESINQLINKSTFSYSENNKDLLKVLKNKELYEIYKMTDNEFITDIKDFIEGKIFLYETSESRRNFYFVFENKIYSGKFIEVPNNENDLYEIVFSETKFIKQKIKQSEKIKLNVSDIKILSKIYLIITKAPYLKKENDSIFFFSTIENNNFKTNIKSKSDIKENIKNILINAENSIKLEFESINEFLHEKDIITIFNKIEDELFQLIKNAKIKNKIYENFMSSVENNLNIKLNKYSFNYFRKNNPRVCVAFSKNKSEEQIQQTMESAAYKFKN